MSGPLVLIEPYAHRSGGHHQRTLLALARAWPGTLVITPYGVIGEAHAALRVAGSRVTGPVGWPAVVLLAAAHTAKAASALGQRVVASRRWPTRLRRIPHQITLFARCWVEAACLRTAGQLAPDPAAVVVLSASEGLPGLASLLGGCPHLRFVHELITMEDLPLRLLGRLARRGEKRVVALYPTAVVRDQMAPVFPYLTGSVRPYAVDDGARLTDADRVGARVALMLRDQDAVVCLVGGWWPYKDITTIDAALIRLRHRLHLLVAGAPLDDAVLHRWRALPQLSVHVMPYPVSEHALRIVYAAADAALVARRPGVGKESGLVMDTARLGVPLIVSDHDPDLTARLAGQEWVRCFPAGGPDALANVLDELTYRPRPPRPGPGAAQLLGLPTATEQVTFLTETYTQLRTGKH